MLRARVDRPRCIGAGNCVLSAEAVFDQDDDGVVVLLAEEVPDGEEERVREAVKLCPSSALRLQE